MSFNRSRTFFGLCFIFSIFSLSVFACPLDEVARSVSPDDKRLIRVAETKDIDRIVEIAQKLALERNQDKGSDWLSNHGFLVSSYGREKYEDFMADERTGTVVIEVQGEIVGFLLYYNKDFIDPKDPGQELNNLAKTSIESAYGDDASLYIIKQVGIDYSSGHRGLGSALYSYLRDLAQQDGINFLYAAVVNDETIAEQAQELGASFPLPNRASARFHTANGFTLAVPLFLYTHERDAEPNSLPSGLHNRELYGIAIDQNRKPLPRIETPAKNLP